MPESQPSKKVGGHTYGRRNLNMSNTAEEEHSVCIAVIQLVGLVHLQCVMTATKHVCAV